MERNNSVYDLFSTSDELLKWFADLTRIERAFPFLMLDALFRRLTFDKSIFTKQQRQILSQHGLYTIEQSAYKDHINLYCAFCTFHFRESKKSIDIIKIIYEHINASPHCNRVVFFGEHGIDSNISFTDIYTKLGLTRISKRSFDILTGLWNGTALELKDISDRKETIWNRYKCIICDVNKRCVYTQCGHVTTCLSCFGNIHTRARCNYCNEDIVLFGRAVLPDRPVERSVGQVIKRKKKLKLKKQAKKAKKRSLSFSSSPI